ncbi:MAG: hydrogenase 4 subunit F [Nitrospirae bacterium]|nr:hydrogenase 4 subunit F [Nitrospirota bacterium]
MIGVLLLIPVVTALLCSFFRNRKTIEVINVIGVIALTAVSVPQITGALSAQEYFMGGVLFMDALSAYIMAIVVFIALVAAIYSVDYMGQEYKEGAVTLKGLRYYYALFHLFIFTMLLVSVSNNLAVFWIAIEGTTLVSALLVGFYKNRQSIEAAWKYIILCTVGITFALLGIFITYYASAGATGGKGTLNWTELREMSHRLNPSTMKLAFILILIGYGTKAGLAPVHNWLPDAHSQAPTPISALLSSILLKCAFIGIVRFAIILNGSAGSSYAGNLLLIFGLLSMGIATAFILLQNNYKRLLAYHSIEHIGIIATGMGLGGPLGIYGSLLHILNHAIVKALLFFTTGQVRLRYFSTKIDKVRGVITLLPVSGAVMLLAALAIAGTPPFNIFLSEFIILKAAAEGGSWVTFTLFLVFATIIFGGVLHHFGGMAFGEPNVSHEMKGERKLVSILIVVMATGMLLLGVYVPSFLELMLSGSLKVITGG